jgi:hypothetical protein
LPAARPSSGSIGVASVVVAGVASPPPLAVALFVTEAGAVETFTSMAIEGAGVPGARRPA